MSNAGDPNSAVRTFFRNALAYEGDECLIWPFNKNPMLRRAQMSVGGKMRIVARLICTHHNGPPPTPKHHAAHSCGNGHLSCVSKRHLTWKTPAENSADMVAHGKSRRGEKQSKLTSEQVREIARLKNIVSARQLASQFDVSSSAISGIHSGRSWSWLTNIQNSRVQP